MHVYIYIKNYPDDDADVVTRSRNTRNYTLRRVPSSLGSNNVCICASLGTQAYLYVHQIKFKVFYILYMEYSDAPFDKGRHFVCYAYIVHGIMEYTRNNLVSQKVITHELNIYGVQFWI